MSARGEVEIHYCPRCRWLPRSTWMAQELLTSFESEITRLTLVPAGSGLFEVWAGGERVWSRADDGGFPELAELKRRVRDRIAPGKDLGHSDTQRG